MSLDYTLPRIDTSLVKFPDIPAKLAVQPRGWWALTQLVLAGLLLTYLFGVVQDVQRVRNLRAEPSAPSKVVITKNEAWQRIYSRPVRSNAWQMSAQVGAHGAQNP
jgi:hypothetical protein